MNTIEAIQTRRSVKHFDPAHRMTEAEIHQLMELAMLSPTSFNIQNWRFVVVTDSELRSKIRAAAWGQAQVTEASVLVVLTADLNAHANAPYRYWKDAPEAVRNTLAPMIEPFYSGKEQLQRDEAMRSIGIASQTIMLASRAMGYDSCPMIGFDAAAVADLINLPEDHVVGMILTVGKALKPANPRGGQLSYDEVVINNRFGEGASTTK